MRRKTGRLAVQAPGRDHHAGAELAHAGAERAVIEIRHLSPGILRRRTIPFRLIPGQRRRFCFRIHSRFVSQQETATVADLDEFRTDVKSWLEDNCPRACVRRCRKTKPSGAVAGEHFVNPDSKLWLERMAERGWTCAHLADRVRRRRLESQREPHAQPRSCGASTRGPRCRASASGCSVRPCWSSPATNRSSSTCRRSSVAKSAGARAIRSPVTAPIWPACRPGPTTRAITISSTARKSGRPMPMRPTGFSAWSAPIPRCAEARRHQLSALRHGNPRASPPRPSS